MPKMTFFYGLLRRREVVLPSWRGSLILLSACAAIAWFLVTRVQPFLAVNRPVGGEVLVVEGWIPDYALRQALDIFRSRPYKLVITTGGPLPQGTAYASYGTHARLAAVLLREFGLAADSLVELPSPEVAKDRTYQEGLMLREWMRSRSETYVSVDVVSFSAHARRSRLLFRKALGGEVKVGVYAQRDLGYDPEAWWKSSNGVRKVFDEVIAYLYAKLIFRG